LSLAVPLPYFYRLVAPVGHRELAGLEFKALTGGDAPPVPRWNERDDSASPPRLAWAGAGVDVGRSAYVSECCRLLAAADTLEELLRASEKLAMRMERFRIRARKELQVHAPDSQDIECALADTISGSPDLSHPVVELVAWGHPDGWLLGELVSRTHGGWRGHEQRPFQYSSALPPRIARAMVNLVTAPGDRLIDPCCGSGTALVEAGYMGMEPFGWEINRNVAEQCAVNLCHHGQAAWMIVGDGRTARGSWDGAVLDLPYGITNDRIEDVCAGLVEHALEVARLVAVVTVDEIDGLIDTGRVEMLGAASIYKNSLHRRVYWMRSKPG